MMTLADELGPWIVASDGFLALVVAIVIVLVLVTMSIVTVVSALVVALVTTADDIDPARPTVADMLG